MPTAPSATGGPAITPVLPSLLALSVLVAALLVLAGTGPGSAWGDEPMDAQATSATSQGTPATPRMTSGPQGWFEYEAPAPVRVHAETVDITAPMIPLGKRDDGRLEVPADADVAGWWTGRATPGERGPAVIAGHVDSHQGPGAFWELGDLEVGDRVTVDRDDGSSLHWRVERVEQHPKDDFPTSAVYGYTEEPTLRLITCSGHFDPQARSYQDNTIVFLTLDPAQEAVAAASAPSAATTTGDGSGTVGSEETAGSLEPAPDDEPRQPSARGPDDEPRQPSARGAASPAGAGATSDDQRSRELPIAIAVVTLLTAAGALRRAWPSRG